MDKFEGADFKHGNTSFKIVAQKYPNVAILFKNTQIRHFCSKAYAFLFFSQNFAITQI